MNIWILIVLVILIETLLHYLPWRLILRGRELPRLIAYIIGMLGLMVPFSIWLWEMQYIQVLLTLWLVIVCGGASVLIMYAIDHWLKLEWAIRDSIEREQLLQEQADAPR